MIIKAKEAIYKREGSNGVFLNLQIEDINTYYDRFDDALVFTFGVFQFIDGQRTFIQKLELMLNADTQRTGYVLLPDTEGTGDTGVPIEEYYAENGTLDGVTVLDYGVPSPELAKTFFTGGDSLDNPEIQPVNELAKEWLLNTLVFDGKKIKDNFEFQTV